jgi:hypothetical protein
MNKTFLLSRKGEKIMNYYDEDYYNEPSEFDMMVDEFKESLIKSVKEEHQQAMNKLQKENAELRVIKKDFESIKKDYENKKRQLDSEYQTLKSNVRRERLKELMKDLEVEMWTVAYKSIKQEKCDKCDDNRRVYFTKPSGKQDYEMCECNSSVHFYEPIPTILNTLIVRNGSGSVYYEVKYDKSWGDTLTYYTDSIDSDKFVTNEEQFKDVWSTKAVFKDIDMAQKYCDYKNKDVKFTSDNAQAVKKKRG